MSSILVTGGTGKLGIPTVARLREAGHEVRILSRSAEPGLMMGDLLTGDGIPAALSGVDTVIHLATGRRDVKAAGNLIQQSRSAGVKHFVLISIVGCDRIPLRYYRDKVAIENLVVGSGLPFTILRATQFHQLVESLFQVQRRSPLLVLPKIALQPIDISDVAARLVEIAGSDAGGRVPDIGGPQRRTLRDLARSWSLATQSRKRIVPVWFPGKVFAGFAAGYHMVPGPAYGTRTFEEHLAARHRRRP
ncbi:MAG TPA: NAD(P)H-binding protein [Glaciibacter sp.]|nr:NAD(P)H-binding protein [Glaciibacter sp.]